MKLIIESVCEFEENFSTEKTKYIVYYKRDFDKIKHFLIDNTIYAYNHGEIYKLVDWKDWTCNILSKYSVTCWERVDNIFPPNKIDMDLSGNLKIDDINEYIYIR